MQNHLAKQQGSNQTNHFENGLNEISDKLQYCSDQFDNFIHANELELKELARC